MISDIDYGMKLSRDIQRRMLEHPELVQPTTLYHIRRHRKSLLKKEK